MTASADLAREEDMYKEKRSSGVFRIVDVWGLFAGRKR